MSAFVQRKLQQAQHKLQNGDVSGAAFLCEEVLQRAPRNPQALWLLGASHIVANRPQAAVALLERAVAAHPAHGPALEDLGLANLMLGDYAAAERTLRKALAVPGAPASVSVRLGIALLYQKRVEEAITCFQSVIAADPANALCHLNLGRALSEAGDDDAARKHFDIVLELEPGHADATFNLGVLALKREDWNAAQALFGRVLENAPLHADALVNLGIALEEQQRLDEALVCFRRALAVDSTLASARNNLARTLLLQGKPEEARAEYLQALERAPELPEAREGLASACAALGRYREAAFHLRALLVHDAKNARAWAALGGALFELGEIDESEAAARRALAIDSALPGPYSLLAQVHFVRGELEHSVSLLEQGFERTGADGLLGMLTHQLRRTCAWEKWRPAWTELQSRLQRSDDLGSPFWLLHENVTACDQLSYTKRWAHAHFVSLAGPRDSRAVRAPPTARPRLRIGYLSSDFQEHAAAYLIAGVLESHDRERFEVFAYSYGPEQPTPMRARLRAACEHFIDVAWEADDAIVRRIRDDELDILVDLKGYTLGARTSILAQRPCPIQVNWLGYPGTMGAPFIDYLITDGFIVPPEDEGAYSERILRLTHCWQCNDRSRPLPEPLTREAYGLREDDFVFCCFTQAVKITPDVFECWMRLLERVPASVLWLAEDNAAATENLRNAAHMHGVAPEKLVFAPRVPFAQHLARYRAADLALDTFPYTSHSTATDALWAGCPIVALCGDTFASRVSGSILTHAGLPELITHTLVSYETLAHSLATEPALLNALQARVAAARSSPLFDAETFARDLEGIYAELVNTPGS